MIDCYTANLWGEKSLQRTIGYLREKSSVCIRTRLSDHRTHYRRDKCKLNGVFACVCDQNAIHNTEKIRAFYWGTEWIWNKISSHVFYGLRRHQVPSMSVQRSQTMPEEKEWDGSESE